MSDSALARTAIGRSVTARGETLRRVSTALLISCAALANAALVSCNKQPVSPPTDVAKISSGRHALPPAAASPADDGNWEMPGKDYAATRFSALNQITPANVSKLGARASPSRPRRPTATKRRRWSSNGTMYLITPFPNYLYALDLTKPGAPTKWVFKPKPARGVAGRRLLRHRQPRRGL